MRGRVRIEACGAAEAKQLALSGTVVPCAADMPYRCLDPGVTRTPIAGPPAQSPVMTPVPGSPPGIDGISLRDVSALQVVPMSHAALKTARRRDRQFPQPVGYDSQTALYDPEEVAGWHAGRR